MTWKLSSSPDEFEAEAGAFLRAYPAENTVLLTLTHNLRREGANVYGDAPARFGWWRRKPGAPVAGAFVQTPPFPVRLGTMAPENAAALARRLHAEGVELPGVGGGASQARAFAQAWTEASGGTATVRAEERLYALGALTPPERPPAGRARVAGAADRELLVEWFGAFTEEIPVSAPADHGPRVDRGLAHGGLLIWEDGGEPVSFAGFSPVLGGMSRVAPVYTPKQLRGRGYASAVTAAATEAAQRAGAEQVLLYTDLANPTSNSIYQKIGYRPVEDSLVYEFGG
ncbi:GNAT family N-acetyltransferase [Kitasatospora sp. NPDC002227]|uniref:GNAT family N-acetyltransferase n=1 Tax=Kitasatospora sp. NPDC002227 TaxID=3154773 RepID=UPI003320CB6A